MKSLFKNIPIESPEEKCDCSTKYCKHFESDFDKYCKENPHCDECEKAMKSECKAPCEESKVERCRRVGRITADLSMRALENADKRDLTRETVVKTVILETVRETFYFAEDYFRSELATAREEGIRADQEQRKEWIKSILLSQRASILAEVEGVIGEDEEHPYCGNCMNNEACKIAISNSLRKQQRIALKEALSTLK